MFYCKCPEYFAIVRHGQSALNHAKGGRLFFEEEGDCHKEIRDLPDHLIPLTEMGTQQSRNAGLLLHKLLGIPERTITSGYLRTNQTAQGMHSVFPVLEKLNPVPIHESLKFRERDIGATDRMTATEVKKKIFPISRDTGNLPDHFLQDPHTGKVLRICSFAFNPDLQKHSRKHKAHCSLLHTAEL